MNLDINTYYEQAKEFRKMLVSEDPSLRELCFQRIQKCEKWSTSAIKFIRRNKFSLNDTKQVIASEQGYSTWADLKRAIETEIEKIRKVCDGRLVIGPCHYEAGDVIENDIVSLGSEHAKEWAVDMILETLYEVNQPHEPVGVVLKKSIKSLAAEGDLLEPPEDDNWNSWAQEVLNSYK